jgi:hypothetical protein
MTPRRAGLARPIRPLVVLAVAALALVIGTQSALGFQVVSQSGKRGARTLQDTETQPGGSCVYDADIFNDLDVIEARSPRVFARDRSSRRDGQWVGIRIQFQKSRGDGGAGGWETVKSTGFVKRFAHDDRSVSIGRRGWQAAYAGTPHFRVRANIRWYKPGTKSVVKGATTLAYQYYDDGAGEPSLDVCLPEP